MVRRYFKYSTCSDFQEGFLLKVRMHDSNLSFVEYITDEWCMHTKSPNGERLITDNLITLVEDEQLEVVGILYGK